MELTNNAIADLRGWVNIAYDTIVEKGGEVPEERSLVNLPDAIGSIWQSTPEVEEKEINFYDYKGNCIYSYTASEAMNLQELPPGPPDDEWVTFHSWSETLEAVNRGLPLDVGAYYDVVDELKEDWDIVMQIKSHGGPIKVSANVKKIDWGDNTIDTSFPATHTYAKSGFYTIKLNLYNGGTLLTSDSDYSVLNFSVIRVHCSKSYLSLRQSNSIIYGNLRYYTHPNIADYAVLYQIPSLSSLLCLVLKNRGKAGFSTYGSCRRSILPTGESLGMWNSNSNGDYMMYLRNLPYGLTVISTGFNRGVITKIPTTCKRLNINRGGNRSTCFMYTPIPPVLVSSSASKLYIPIGSLSDYQNATNYGLATFIECIPTEINSFSITADDVAADATTTTIHVKANLSMKAWYDDTMVPRDFERDIISEDFGINESVESREVTISYTMLGETRTCTIIQEGDPTYIPEVELLSEAAVTTITNTYGLEVLDDVYTYLSSCENPGKMRYLINQDPDIVCSISEKTSKTRWLVGDGKAYVDSGIRLKSGSSIESYCQIIENVDDKNFVFGSYASNNRYALRTIINSNNGVFIQMRNGTGAQLADNGFNPHRIVLAEDTCYIDDTAYSNNYEITDNGFDVYLFSCNGLAESGFTASISKSKISYVIFGGDTQAHFIPYNNGTECGMLDLVSLQFFPNSNTEGQFTIQITDKE